VVNIEEKWHSYNPARIYNCDLIYHFTLSKNATGIVSQYRESFPQFSFIIFLISRLSSPDNTFRSIERTDGCTSSNSPETNARRVVVGSFHLTRQCVLVEMGCDRVCSMHTIPTASAFIREDADLLVQVRDKASTDYRKISGDIRRERYSFLVFLTKR